MHFFVWSPNVLTPISLMLHSHCLPENPDLQWHPPQTKFPWLLHLFEFSSFNLVPLHCSSQSSQDTSRVSLSSASCNSIFTLAFLFVCFSKQNFSFTLISALNF